MAPPRACWRGVRFVSPVGPTGCSSLTASRIPALQTLPTSGLLHAHSVWSEPRPTRKSRSVDALKKTNNSPVIIVTVARLFWSERKVEKARDWFTRAVTADPDYGDAWAWWYKFELNHGTQVLLVDFPHPIGRRC